MDQANNEEGSSEQQGSSVVALVAFLPIRIQSARGEANIKEGSSVVTTSDVESVTGGIDVDGEGVVKRGPGRGRRARSRGGRVVNADVLADPARGERVFERREPARPSASVPSRDG